MTTQNWTELSKIDPEFEEVLKSMGGPPPVLESDIPTLRRLLIQRKEQLTATQQADTSGVTQEDLKAPARDGYSIPVRVYSPKSPPSAGSPLVVFLHGGGFCLGDLENEELNCQEFCKLGCVVVNVDYRLAPEHPFPTPINDSWDAVKWAAENASKLKADPSKGFIVGGTSAGGNMSAAIALLARDEKLSPPLTGLCLLIPAIMDYRAIPDKYKDEVKSYEQNKDAPILSQKSIDIFMANYNPDLSSSLYNIFASPANHKGLPPTYFQICGMDPLRDEALIFERVLREESGTKTKVDLYPGLPHGFWSFFPDMNCSRQFVKDTVKGMEWLLQQAG